MDALGGTDAWNKTRFLRFDFAVDREGKTVVRRSHVWDKWTGRYRLEATTHEGAPYVVLMNINERDGRAFIKGSEVSGEEGKKLVDQGYSIWVNDTYWLLMPYKMKDPGVHLEVAGQETKGDGNLGQAPLELRERRPHPEGPVLGLRQSQDRPGGPLGLRAEGREQAEDHVHVDELEEARQP